MKTYCYILLMFLVCLGGCRKQEEWLDEKITNSSVVPSRLKDYTALMDWDQFNQGFGFLAVLSTDHFYLSTADFNAATTAVERNGYTWVQDIYQGGANNLSEWSGMYRIVSAANVCLEGLEKITPNVSTEAEFRRLRGTALFYRALAYYQLLQHFAAPYDPATYTTDPGVPIRLSSDVNIRPGRSTVKECYEQINKDLSEALGLLPQMTAFKTRPNLVAAQALMAKVYLMTEQWVLAEQLASQALSQYSALIDFNVINTAASIPFPTFQAGHAEVILHLEGSSFSYFSANRAVVDSTLYRSYVSNDLRRAAFFRTETGVPIFKGYYTGKTVPIFSGIATNEVMLIKAEALARLGQKDASMGVLNGLLVKRWRTGTYVLMSAIDADDALRKVITERRKELPFTGSIAWEDLRRLNRDPRFSRTMRRIVNSTTYTLPPKDPRYVFAIPDQEIRLTGIPQNIR
ncbi:RagB/SusD family nutrient uptake outer membrane protein [Sediminibacterium sp.]|uniref:RagB/SusD family nutrient uptake outer membrane protein n=1 Tax=Sediminibacterium sp. TaxID=1917865 RepID=UPI0027304A88|nr:RagB/SusD family nutrient uptake outer membrane protein [Sediminibacterium sp.]MDP2421440.1 RagB/SusD family nutrient uptake outer membrane protein [Sediminibacterium sp.]